MTVASVAACHALQTCFELGTGNCGNEHGVAECDTNGARSRCGDVAPASTTEKRRIKGQLPAIVLFRKAIVKRADARNREEAQGKCEHCVAPWFLLAKAVVERADSRDREEAQGFELRIEKEDGPCRSMHTPTRPFERARECFAHAARATI